MHVLWIAVALAWSPAPQGHADFASFYQRFRKAVASVDGATIASLTALPFQLDGRQLDSAEFARRAGELFDEGVRRCLPQASAVPEGDAMTVSCPPYIFYFRIVGDDYRLSEFAADPEAVADSISQDTALTTSDDIGARPFRLPWVFGPVALGLLLAGAVLMTRTRWRARRGDGAARSGER